MKRSVETGGITTASSYKDGDSLSCVNLRRKNGVLKPVKAMKKVGDLYVPTGYSFTAYDIVFKHKLPGGEENYIGVALTNNNDARVFFDVTKESVSLITDYGARINSIEQNGNLLCFISDSEIYYMFWTGSRYVDLGKMPEMVPVKFSAPTLEAKTVEMDITGIDINNDNVRDVITNNLQSAINRARMLELGDNSVFLYDLHFIRYAYKLFDGSYTKLSPPVLIAPPENISSFVQISTADSKTFQITVKRYKLQIDYDFSSIKNYSNIIKSVDIFLSPPLGFASFTDMDAYRAFTYYYYSGMTAGIAYSLVEARSKNTSLMAKRDKKYSPTGVGKFSGGAFASIDGVLKRQDDLAVFRERQLLDYMSKEVNDNSDSVNPMDTLKEMSNFYKVKSIAIYSDATQTQMVFPEDSHIMKGTLNSLATQEELYGNLYYPHSIGGKKTYKYNKNLHLYDLKIKLHSGFNLDMFIWGSNYNGFPGGYRGTLPGQSVQYVFEVTLDTQYGAERVYSHVSIPLKTDSWGGLFMSGFFSYPDSRAKRLVVYAGNTVSNLAGMTRRLDVSLTEHKFLDMAYYVQDNAIPITGYEMTEVTLDESFSKPTYEYRNDTMAVSGNHISFRNVNFYEFNSKILSLGSQSGSLSQNDFGQYPLIAFTENGIFTLSVSTDSDFAYSHIVPALSKSLPANSLSLETPLGAVYFGRSGLSLISGAADLNFGDFLEQNPNSVQLLDRDGAKTGYLDGVLLNYSVSYNDFIRDATQFVYDFREEEIIIFNDERDASGGRIYPFLLVVGIKSKYAYARNETIDGFVSNSFPDTLVIQTVDGQQVIKRLEGVSEEEYVHVSIITRPIRLGTVQYKALRRIIVRGLFLGVRNTGGKQAVALAYAGLDELNFKPLKGLALKDSSLSSGSDGYKDIDFGLTPRSAYRNYIIGFAGTVSDRSEIQYIDFEEQPDYNKKNNIDKMR
ncbi:MAG: hypothetical protein LBJ17_08745 [Dysgonamonadaceae bacterium]|nr:hypothetical protein [Dysgonamonadaceae bacterium]